MLRLSLIIIVFSHVCHVIKPSIEYLKGRRLQAVIQREESWNNIRFHTDWSQLSLSDKSKYKKYIDAAFVYFSNALKVHRITTSSSWDDLFSTDTNCTTIVKKYKNKLISDTDMIVMISTEFDESNLYIGHSVTCAYDPQTFQPIATFIKVNKAYMESSRDSEEANIMLFIHELAHALGFSYSDMQNFRNKQGKLYEPEELFTDLIVRGMKPQRFLSTPKVKELARKAFACNNIPGVQLESQGTSRIALNHWDKRMMFTDFMGPQVLLNNIVYSDISLAVFEDSGWYLPNYTYSTPINFGYHSGCDFIFKKCILNQRPLSIEFCTESTSTFCDSSHLNYGLCDINEFGFTLPPEYQYFSEDSIGGDTLCDYCPVNTKVFNCRASTSTNYDSGETTCNDCRCASTTLSLTSSNPVLSASCYKIKCLEDRFLIFVAGLNATCLNDTKSVKFQGFYGSIICPKYERVCKDVPCRFNCYGGLCVKGRCVNGGDVDEFEGEDYPEGIEFPCLNNCKSSNDSQPPNSPAPTSRNGTGDEDSSDGFAVVSAVCCLAMFIFL